MNTKKADTLSRTNLTNLVAQALERLPAGKLGGLVVAYSGGVDSHVLLECARDWCRSQQSKTNIAPPLRAHHIDHGLQPGSAGWAVHCSAVCRQLQVDLTTSQVMVDLHCGHSPEDAARRARYDALRADLQADEVLLTAHHADDQAETLLLQLFRGAGVNGLAAMPEYVTFGSGHLARPMLQVTADRIREFARVRQLTWIEDPSNRDDGFDRNLLRNQVMPLLRNRWPAIANSISRSASHCAEAADINRIFANDALGEHIDSRELKIPLLAKYSDIENKVLLRSWIEHHGFRMPSAAKVNHLLTDLLAAGFDSAGEVSWGNACIRRYRDCLYLGASADFQICKPFRYDWPELRQSLVIQETGQVLTRQDISAPHRRVNGGLVVCSRQGGEQIRLSGHRMHKSVKNLFQECAIPPWDRDKVPFVYRGDTLIGIVGIGFTD